MSGIKIRTFLWWLTTRAPYWRYWADLWASIWWTDWKHEKHEFMVQTAKQVERIKDPNKRIKFGDGGHTVGGWVWVKYNRILKNDQGRPVMVIGGKSKPKRR